MRASSKSLHIVSFDVPYPADYGGVIDVFFKIKALHQLGVRIHLHCYEYGREHSKELLKYCEKVYYYRRRVYKNPILGRRPYIVTSRQSDELLQRLLENNWPILFEGLHTTAFLSDKRLEGRFKMVRMHNVEHHYYKHLEVIEKNYFKKYFFRVESERLQRYQRVLKDANLILAISTDETAYFKRRWNHVMYLPPFHSNESVDIQPGKGQFALYHGNLGVGENSEAAMFLLKEVFNDLEIPLVIAGNRPPQELVRQASLNPQVELRHHISTKEIHELISSAQINVLFTNQSTGIKLKLINVLFKGRHCLVNPKMVNGTGLKSLCAMAKTADEFKKELKNLYNKPFPPSELRRRQENLKAFETLSTAKQLLEILP